MKRSNWAILAASLALVPCTAGAQAVISERTLSLDAAMTIAQTAMEACRKEGYKVTITVLNRAARTKVVMHEDGANPHTLENSLRKAYTALTFRRPSGEFGKAQQKNPPPHAQVLLDKVTTGEGGLPIVSNKEVIGSIGISGAPGGHRDAACAKAGIDKIAGEL